MQKPSKSVTDKSYQPITLSTNFKGSATLSVAEIGALESFALQRLSSMQEQLPLAPKLLQLLLHRVSLFLQALEA